MMKETLKQVLKNAPLRPDGAFKSAVDDALNRLSPRPMQSHRNAGRLAVGLCAALVLITLPLAHWYIESGRNTPQAGPSLAKPDTVESPMPISSTQATRASVALAPGEIAYIVKDKSLVRTQIEDGSSTGDGPSALQLSEAVSALEEYIFEHAHDVDLTEPVSTPNTTENPVTSLIGTDLDSASLLLEDDWQIGAESISEPPGHAVDMPTVTTPDDAILIPSVTGPDESIRIPTVIEDANEQQILMETPSIGDQTTTTTLTDGDFIDMELDIQFDLGPVSLRLTSASWNEKEHVLTWVTTIEGEDSDLPESDDQVGFHGIRLNDVLFRGMTAEPDIDDPNPLLILSSARRLPIENNRAAITSQLKIDVSDSDQWGTLPITLDYADDKGNSANVNLWVRYEKGKGMIVEDGN